MNDLIRRKAIAMQANAAEYARYASFAGPHHRAEARYWQRRAAECSECVRWLLDIEP